MVNRRGAIMYDAHVVNDDPKEFYDHVNESIRESESSGFYTEVQYQAVIQYNGKALHCALILGREREATHK